MQREFCSDACYDQRKRKLRIGALERSCGICGAALGKCHGRRKYCQGCRSEASRRYGNEHRLVNVDAENEYKRNQRRKQIEADPEGLRARERVARDRRITAIRAYTTSPEYRAKANARAKQKRQTDPKWRLRAVVRTSVHQALRGKKGWRKWQELLGYSVEELMSHLERQFAPGMSWANMGKWEIDHIVPVAAFKYESPDDPDFKASWALTNLRPLWRAENRTKNAKRTHLL